MKIGDVAKKLNTTVQAIRYYEREGLITARRNQAGTRYFLDEDVIRLKVIRNLVDLGIPLASLKTLATTRAISRSGDESSHSVAAQIDELSRMLKDQRSAIDEAIADLSNSKKVIRDCYECSKKPIRKNCEPCPVFKKVNRAEINQLIWEQSDESDTS
jgi:DNA-binding transcriptional MerR regulator